MLYAILAAALVLSIGVAVGKHLALMDAQEQKRWALKCWTNALDDLDQERRTNRQLLSQLAVANRKAERNLTFEPCTN